MKISLVVTEASPLITLAMADALDTLLLQKVPVIVPDMVEYEVVSHADKSGAKQVARWLAAHRDQVEIGTTEVFDEFLAGARRPLARYCRASCLARSTRQYCCLRTPRWAR